MDTFPGPDPRKINLLTLFRLSNFLELVDFRQEKPRTNQCSIGFKNKRAKPFDQWEADPLNMALLKIIILCPARQRNPEIFRIVRVSKEWLTSMKSWSRKLSLGLTYLHGSGLRPPYMDGFMGA